MQIAAEGEVENARAVKRRVECANASHVLNFPVERGVSVT
jgi:hypothetical protein